MEIDYINNSNRALGSVTELAQALIFIADEMDDKKRVRLISAWELAYDEIEDWAGPDSTRAHVHRMAHMLSNFSRLGAFLDAIAPAADIIPKAPTAPPVGDAVDGLLADL